MQTRDEKMLCISRFFCEAKSHPKNKNSILDICPNRIFKQEAKMSECCCGSNCESVTKEVNGKIESIKVLGSGCKNCHTLHQNVIDALAEMNLAVNLEYVTDLQKIMEAGVMSMPALMVNGE